MAPANVKYPKAGEQDHPPPDNVRKIIFNIQIFIPKEGLAVKGYGSSGFLVSGSFPESVFMVFGGGLKVLKGAGG